MRQGVIDRREREKEMKRKEGKKRKKEKKKTKADRVLRRENKREGRGI